MTFVVLIGAIPHLDPIQHSADLKSCETEAHEHHFIAYHHHHLGTIHDQEIPGIIDFILGFHTHSDHDRVEMEFLPSNKSEAAKSLLRLAFTEFEEIVLPCGIDGERTPVQLFDLDPIPNDGFHSSRSLRAPPFVS